ncbi:hypothetical protein Cob_v002809 [Colletotrichum orbiculare MAFF 240422]|uniref:Uncharacterized protein n=1 Tax=Colletotrichum orbiculare (strain 104-T / ATCC 96160 / CBS 514.97 / LARS 414 / MAFF 240422) TaxID=1213857 RepID=A0A484G2D5_COLOR|nr:hypothetical protein Cob_v002809 [Colletotrichum orbiculare MAFF 240422]
MRGTHQHATLGHFAAAFSCQARLLFENEGWVSVDSLARKSKQNRPGGLGLTQLAMLTDLVDFSSLFVCAMAMGRYQDQRFIPSLVVFPQLG